jgi:nitric oxide reductase large subunit
LDCPWLRCCSWRRSALIYKKSPPIPDDFVSSSGKIVTTKADLFAGKAAFQEADLMDYGSLYGMGSYFGQTLPPNILSC